jgi:hypothetical protein
MVDITPSDVRKNLNSHGHAFQYAVLRRWHDVAESAFQTGRVQNVCRKAHRTSAEIGFTSHARLDTISARDHTLASHGFLDFAESELPDISKS